MAKYIELKKLLLKNGFKYWRNGKGSHEIWIHPTGVRTTITKHSKEISKVVEKNILKAIAESKGE